MVSSARSVTMSFFTLLTTLLFIGSSSAGWVLEDDYSASEFFDMFSFFTSSDPTHGFVDYVSQSDAQSGGLISTTSDSVYIGVDYTNQAPSGRASVRLTSNKSYNAGTLVILDLEHMPGGVCGTWPAFWSVGPNWPAGGEIDIIEGVNTQTTNDMTLHTSTGCSITNNNAFSGSISTDNCYVYAEGQSDNAGCQIDTENTATYGAGFNANGGGVYAMEWTTSAINIYFFQRGSIPSDVSSSSPDPSGWGTPVAQFQGECDIASFFTDNQLVFDTTFCGDWAGAVWASSECYSSQYPTCDSYVAANPSAFKDAYWQVNSLQVFSETSGSASTSSASSASSAAASTIVNVPVTTESSATSTTSSTTSSATSSATSSSVASLTSSAESSSSTASSAVSIQSTSTTSSAASATSSDSTVKEQSNGQVDTNKNRVAASVSISLATSSSSATSTTTSQAASSTSTTSQAASSTSTTSQAASSTSTTAAAAAATTTDSTPTLDVEVEADGTIAEDDESAPTATGSSRRRRWDQRPRRRDESSVKLSQDWGKRLEAEKLRRMRHVRNVGSLHGSWRH